MIDAKLIRSNTDEVRAALARRGAGELVDEFLELDAECRKLTSEVETVRAERNAAAKAIAEAKQKGDDTTIVIAKQSALKARQADDEALLAQAKARLAEVTVRIPNIPDPTAADGLSEDDAVTLSTHGEPPEFGFDPKDHLDLAGPDGLGLIDMEAAARVSGSRFAYLKGDLVRLQFALVQWGLAQLVEDGFVPVIPPVLVREAAMEGTGFFPEAREQVYGVPEDELFLVGTAEVPLASLHGGSILAEQELPLRYVGYSTCFRREAGAGGKDTRGIFRVHQFDKLEMFVYCLPEHSQEEHDRILAIEERIAQAAGLPLPRAEHPRRRPGRLGRQEVRHRGLAARPAALPRADLVLELHRLPGPPARHPLPLRAGAATRAHAERHRGDVEPHAAGADRVRPAAGRLDPHARAAARLRRAAGDRGRLKLTRR